MNPWGTYGDLHHRRRERGGRERERFEDPAAAEQHLSHRWLAARSGQGVEETEEGMRVLLVFWLD